MRNPDIQNELNSIKNQKFAKIKDGHLYQIEQANNRWLNMYELAKQYRIDHNGNPPTESYKTKDGIALGRWESIQREFRKSGELSQERIDLLDAINFSWDVPDRNWILAYNELKLYKKKFKSVKVPESYITENGFKLGSWCSRQRKAVRPLPPSHAKKNRKQLSKVRKKMLDDIGFIWNVRKTK
jgi:hypothetical protein